MLDRFTAPPGADEKAGGEIIDRRHEISGTKMGVWDVHKRR